jgi:hypothetical protein
MPNIYAQDLPKNDANFAALTPLLYLERSALVYPDRVAIIHGALRQTWAQTYARCRQLAKEGSKLVYRCAKQRSEPTSDKRGAKADELHLTPLELIDRIAALVPPPRTHRHRYFGVLAPNSPLRAAVTALAQPAASQPATVETAQPGAGVPGVAAPGNAATPTPEPEARPKRAAHYLWAVLIARIYEAFPLLCPMCGGQMRIIAFITHSAEIRHILNHIGVESAPPHITPARGPPLWEGCDAPVDDGAQGEPDWDLAAQPDEVDQRVNW